MTRLVADPRADRSPAALLAAVAMLVVAYASLYPFAGWQWPAGAAVMELLRLPWPRYNPTFDIWSNLIGYMPLGGLIALALWREARSVAACVILAALASSGLSYTMEVTQHLIPGRVPSVLDWLLNSAGGLLGALLVTLVTAQGWLGHWTQWRRRWFSPDAGGILVLLACWPLGLLFPAPFPMGLGLSWERLQDGLVGLLLDVDWAQGMLEWVSDLPTPYERPVAAVSGLGMVLGLLAPCLLLGAVTRPGWRRAVLCLLTIATGLAMTTLAAAVNFGPGHALGWLGVEVEPALITGVGLALLTVPLGPRLLAALGIAALAILVMLVAQVPADPYFAVSLQAWEQGRFIRFHGLAQWVGWLWPFMALLALVRRLSARS